MMASHHHLLPFLLLLLSTTAHSTPFLLPIFKTTDHSRPQYHAKLQIGTPSIPITLTLDTTNPYTWLACDLVNYTNSSSYSSVSCDSPTCLSFSGPSPACLLCSGPPGPSPSCNPNQCLSLSPNPQFSDSPFLAPLLLDSATLFRPSISLPNLPLACVSTSSFLKGLSSSSNGILSLSLAPTALQLHVNSPRIFALCLPSSSSGAAFFGGPPYPITAPMVSVPLLVNANSSVSRFGVGDPSIFYYIKVDSISIDGSSLGGFDSSLLSFDSEGNGGTMVSTVAPYGKLNTEIYKPFVEMFLAKVKAMNVTVVGPARADLGVCFDPKSVRYDPRTGLGLPVIELVMEGGGRWRILGSNYVVKVKKDAWCLGFVDAGKRTSARGVWPAVVIGGLQMEDNLVEFDLVGSMLRVTSSLLKVGTSCSKFS